MISIISLFMNGVPMENCFLNLNIYREYFLRNFKKKEKETYKDMRVVYRFE